MIAKLPAFLRLLRPSHWIKNLFVLAGVFFSGDWKQPHLLWLSIAAFIAFCLASSGVYSLNDALDVDGDRNHPRKRLRPVATGVLSKRVAFLTSGILTLSASAMSAWVSLPLALIIAGYVVINILYSTGLKNRELLDVFCIALGFILRLLAGTLGIGIGPSNWFLLCTLFMSLFLGFSKRYAELIDRSGSPVAKRQVLTRYSPEFLQVLLGVTLSATLITYALYTTSPRTTEVHHTTGLIYTLPFVVWGMFRYLYRVMSGGFGEDTVADILTDKQILAVSSLYFIATGCLLFFGSSLN